MTVTTLRPVAPVPRLADFAAPGHVPPVKTYRFKAQRVLAFDQALAFTGVVDVIFDGPGIEIASHKTVVLDHDLKGVPATMVGGELYYNIIRNEILSYLPLWGTIVFEQPPTANRMIRPESSMMAGLCIKIVCGMGQFPCEMVQAQRAKTVWAANPRATKAQLKRAILEKFPALKAAMSKATEHEWDALALAMTYAFEGEDGG